MSGLVLPLDDIRGGDVSVAGGKGANLGELAANGFPVPAGFVVSSDASHEYFELLGLRRELLTIDNDPAAACARLQHHIVHGQVGARLQADILDAHARLAVARPGAFLCAVRSSATAEDLAGASFAGQHGTYYDVPESLLIDRIKRCWASLWSIEAVTYRSSRGIRHDTARMAVVVQEMVRSDVSGVAFTAHPVTGDRGELVIEASWGLGAALVDGRVTPDRYVIAREGLRVRERHIADKRFLVSAHPTDGYGHRLEEVLSARRRAPTLDAGLAQVVAAWAIKCEAHFGSPQDVEWAIVEGRFHLLQSRPITTRARVEGAKPVTGQWVMFKPVAENFTDPISPLMSDLLPRAFEPALKVIGGRIYQNLAYIRPFVPVRLTDPELATAVYTMFGQLPRPLRVSWARLPVAAVLGILFWLFSAVAFARTRAMPDDFMDMYRDLCRQVDGDDRLGPTEALLRLGMNFGLLAPIGRMPILVNTSAIRFAFWFSALAAMIRRWAPGLPDGVASRLSSGDAGVLSAQMGREVESLARHAAQVRKVATLFEQGSTDTLLARLRQEREARSFLASLDSFLAVHGHRALKEFEPMAPRWDENPAAVLGLVRNHLLTPVHARPSDAADTARAAAERAVHDALQSRRLERRFGLRWRLVQLAAARSRYFFKLRENSRFYHIMAIGCVRRKVLAYERDLIARGLLKCQDDIFFLKMREIEALRSGRLTWRDVEDRVRERRIEFVRLSKITPPRAIGVSLAGEASSAATAERDRLQGLPASPGLHVGRARVVLDPAADATLKPGEVLVAPYTDPAWTPLFLIAGAAVVEVGSYLSHAGTVAREYGMPCVVDVPDCTSRIATGATVEVDGSRGFVRVLEEPRS